MEKLMTVGFYKFLGYYLDQLKARKLVAQFDDYELAKTDIMREAMNHNPEQTEGLTRALAVVENETDIIDYWESLGTNKKVN